MVKKCKNCNAKIIEYPIYKGQEVGEPFSFNKINWYNLLIGDWTKTLIIISILFMSWSYYHDTQEIEKINSNPCKFITSNYEACLNAESKGEKLNISSPGLTLNFTIQ